MLSDDTALATEFDRHRGRLVGIAYRLTGRVDDAEDAVQEAWLRLAAERSQIRELGAWLTTVVSRICLDRLRSAAVRREQYVGPWLPEPVVTELDSHDPQNIVVTRDDIRMAALRVLHELSPEQRLAFVLHDGFDVPFTEIAEIAGCAVATARQHASRARRALAAAEPAPRVPLPEQRRVLDNLLAALSSGDITEITRALHPQAALFGDSDGRASTARRPILGQEKIARFLAGLLAKYGETLYSGMRPVLVNGDLGLVFPALPERQGRVVTFACRDGLISEVFDIVNPDKLVRAPVRAPGLQAGSTTRARK
ncbi:sigma-70 family RNA polymerase sigma factor [Saccharopolyspora erythraea]|uniref:sigma-70 family RNA polymerase sigma factor n=1 Tax=Saccharopolyspora erythraea TaxID=1836 RepID=UPI001BA578CD|nr:sigma-70 family RNA polymerase sigma factor [Saccharopolyspora erythraea]QUH01091.1 sigma-70 family RNA polymerase sigma factor [Saccharopolyspora erythraea]